MSPPELRGLLARTRRVLALRLDNVGDVVMLGPALRALRRAAPEAELTLLASPGGARAAPLLAPWLDDVITHRAPWQQLDAGSEPDLAAEHLFIAWLREFEFDAAFVFTSFSQTPHAAGYALYLAGVPVRVGQSAEFGGAALSHAVPPAPREGHQVDRNLHLLAGVGIRVEEDRELAVHVSSAARRRAVAMLADAGVGPSEEFVLIAPGASCEARRYAPERFAEVARLLAAAGQRVVLVGSPAEAALAAEIAAAARDARITSLAGRTTIEELAAVIERARLVICNNSGPLHVADALRVPLVVTYSGTDLESQWRPRSSRAVLLRRPTPCAPCYAFTCPLDRGCLDIAPEHVVAKARALLELAPARRRASAAAGSPGGAA